jgi:hypothetical protein
LKSALEEYTSQLQSPIFLSLNPDQQLSTLQAY